ncbi:MAG TPA: hypothetical protein PKD26_12075 [Pyrinomonadaceae bacterium]|nr:hypothetical protein [Pyrinomonadaceae bacterium]
MRLFFRFLFPATYFEATRVPSLELKIYNGLVEWLPAFAFALYFNDLRPQAVLAVLFSYGAFISIYEIGYLTNDLFSEKYEDEPRGRASRFQGSEATVYALIAVRLIFFAIFTSLLGAANSWLWWGFHGSLVAVFALHNILPGEMRVATFFCLSAFRFFGPMIIAVPPLVLMVLFPAVLLNHSLYRTTVYLRSKFQDARVAETVLSKLAFYAGCFPLSVLLSFLYDSWIPAGLCVYFGLIWIMYLAASRVTGWKPGPG